MINKSLVKKRFSKSLKTYDENAIIQKIMAEKLVSFLPKKSYNSIFETGCATGILTTEIKKNLQFKEFCANDLVEAAQEYITEIIPYSSFIAGDIEEISLDKKYDLIISNASLQWCNDIEKTILKLKNSLNRNGILAISIFGDENIHEVNSIFNIENKTYVLSKLKECLTNLNVIKMEEESLKLTFKTPIDVLKHLKLTGVNALKEYRFTKSDLKNFEQKYIDLYSNQSGVELTYNPVYIIITN